MNPNDVQGLLLHENPEQRRDRSEQEAPQSEKESQLSISLRRTMSLRMMSEYSTRIQAFMSHRG